MRKQEVFEFGLGLGALCVLVPANLFMLFGFGKLAVGQTVNNNFWLNTENIFRLFTFVALIVAGTGGCIQIFKA